MTARRSWSDSVKLAAVAVLLGALVVVFMLRAPAHPLVGYGPSVEFRSHRIRILPSYAILNDVFQAVVLQQLRVFLVSDAFEHHVSAPRSVPARDVTPTLRC